MEIMMDPTVLMSGIAISTVGLGIFIYGKRMEKTESLGVGLAMMVFPIFVTSIPWMWLIAAGCIAGLFILSRSA